MSFRNLQIALLPCTLALTSAHPGHGLLDHGAGHVATSPYHLFLLLGVALASFAVGQLVRNSWAKRFLRSAGATALIAAGVLGLFGF